MSDWVWLVSTHTHTVTTGGALSGVSPNLIRAGGRLSFRRLLPFTLAHTVRGSIPVCRIL